MHFLEWFDPYDLDRILAYDNMQKTFFNYCNRIVGASIYKTS
jgi:hypothetical protein